MLSGKYLLTLDNGLIGVVVVNKDGVNVDSVTLRGITQTDPSPLREIEYDGLDAPTGLIGLRLGNGVVYFRWGTKDKGENLVLATQEGTGDALVMGTMQRMA